MWLADLAADSVRRMELPGGDPVTGICRGPNASVTAWTESGSVFNIAGDRMVKLRMQSVCVALSARGATQLMVSKIGQNDFRCERWDGNTDDSSEMSQ